MFGGFYSTDQFIGRSIPKCRQKKTYSASDIPLTIDWRVRLVSNIVPLLLCLITLHYHLN